MRRVIKKINNNVVLAKDSNGQESVLVGKGLGFRQIPYDLDNDNLIEHEFVDAKSNNRLTDAFEELPTEVILLTEKIINVGKLLINKELNNSLLLTLSDHIAYAMERAQKHIEFDPKLQLDLKHIYPEEVNVGKIAIQMVKDELNIDLPKSEASSIALHFINAEYQNEMGETYKLTKTINDILAITEKYAPSPLNEDSVCYSRFVTHIRYFILRQKEGVVFPTNSNADLEKLVSNDASLINCVNEIKEYIKTTYGWVSSKEEDIYLLIHLKNLFYYQNN